MADPEPGSPDIRLTHVGLCVDDLSRAVSFYTDALGFTEVHRLHVADAPTATILDLDEVDLDLVYLESGGVRIELLGYTAPATTPSSGPRPMNHVGLTHLSLLVRDFDATCRRIVAAGGRLLGESETSFAHGNRGIMALDPDGTRIELIEARPR